jgi:NAD(P)-dependent dehydrogenase (short-subunit alcohol dehydrogenase family)
MTQVLNESFEVNVFAMIRVNNAFLPHLTRCPESRIVLMGSYAGKSFVFYRHLHELTTKVYPNPNNTGRFTFSAMSLYCASKHSVRVLANSMRRELKPFKVQVVHIEPSMYSTGITNQQSCLANLRHHWTQTDLGRYSNQVQRQAQVEYAQTCQQVQDFMDTTNDDVQQVLDTIKSALFYRHPLPFYRVSTLVGRLVMYALEWLPEELHDLVLGGQVYGKLVKLLQMRRN